VTRVNQLMSPDIVTIAADASCHDAVTLMVRSKIRHLPVVDRDGRLSGVVTDRDLRHRLFEPATFRAIGRVPVERLLSDLPVRDVMSAPATSIGGDADVAEAARVMRERHLGSLPVVEHGRIIGIVTETDLLRQIVGADACCTDVEAIVVSYP
jgi:acetoin utilization protein AcuB